MASVIRLRSEHEASYRQLHAQPCEEVLATLRAANITNYSIFLRDGLLFSYFEYNGDDYAADATRIAANEHTRLWWALTDPCQEPIDSAAADEWWAPAEEIFHLD